MNNKLLFIDDSPSNLKVMGKFFQVCGYTVDTCSSCEEALNLLARNSYSLCLVDYNMPELNGVEAIKKIHLVSPGAKVILFSADASASVSREGLAAGALGVIYKHDDPEKIIQAIEMYCNA